MTALARALSLSLSLSLSLRVWKVKFNPAYSDQLLLSSSTDGVVNLWDVAQVTGSSNGGAAATSHSSSNAPASSRFDSGELLPIKTYEEHEDSVYGIAWSGADPWLFASLSYDGRVVVRRVLSAALSSLRRSSPKVCASIGMQCATERTRSDLAREPTRGSRMMMMLRQQLHEGKRMYSIMKTTGQASAG